MNETEKTIKKRIEVHKKIMQETQEKARIIKERAQEQVEHHSDISRSSEIIKEAAKKKGELLDIADAWISADQLDHTLGEDYPDYIARDKQTLDILTLYMYDMQQSEVDSRALAATASTSALTVVSDVEILADTWMTNTTDNKLQQEIGAIGVEDTTHHHIEFIKNKLRSSWPNLVSPFERVTRDISGTKGSDLHRRLLDLRSIIFDQLLEVISPIKEATKYSWCKTGMKGRFCQTKFFIIGYTAESSLPSSALRNINNLAADFADCFHKLSGYGKKGEKEVTVKNLIKKTLSTFVNILELRDTFNRPTP